MRKIIKQRWLVCLLAVIAIGGAYITDYSIKYITPMNLSIGNFLYWVPFMLTLLTIGLSLSIIVCLCLIGGRK